ncbi:hypothetical protein OKW29_000515 [Paraburkholderia sp. CI3]
MSLQVLAYNLKRVVKILGVAKTIEVVRMADTWSPEGHFLHLKRYANAAMTYQTRLIGPIGSHLTI